MSPHQAISPHTTPVDVTPGSGVDAPGHMRFDTPVRCAPLVGVSGGTRPVHVVEGWQPSEPESSVPRDQAPARDRASALQISLITAEPDHCTLRFVGALDRSATDTVRSWTAV